MKNTDKFKLSKFPDFVVRRFYVNEKGVYIEENKTFFSLPEVKSYLKTLSNNDDVYIQKVYTFYPIKK